MVSFYYSFVVLQISLWKCCENLEQVTDEQWDIQDGGDVRDNTQNFKDRE